MTYANGIRAVLVLAIVQYEKVGRGSLGPGWMRVVSELAALMRKRTKVPWGWPAIDAVYEPSRSSPELRCMAISVSRVWLPLEATHQSNATDLTPNRSEICAVTVTGESGGGVLKLTSVING